MANFFWQYVAKTPFYGAQTTIYCCLAENLQSGKYYDNCKEEKLLPKALLVEDQEKLWDLSERLVNQSNKNHNIKKLELLTTYKFTVVMLLNNFIK